MNGHLKYKLLEEAGGLDTAVDIGVVGSKALLWRTISNALPTSDNITQYYSKSHITSTESYRLLQHLSLYLIRHITFDI